jgi:hypothetical protein
VKQLIILLLLIISVYAYSQIQPMKKGKRYFFVGYSGTTKEGYAFSGGIDYVSPDFVNLEEARTFIRQQQNLQKVFVTSIYEFKSEADYKRFWK